MIYKRKGTPMLWGRYRGHRFSLGTMDKPLAQKVYSQRRIEIDEDQQLPGQREHRTRTLRNLIERYISEHGHTLAASKTMYHKRADGEITGYARRLYDFFKPETRLIEITADKIAQYKTHRAKPRGTQPGLTPVGINRELSMLRGAFEMAVNAWGWAKVNPVTKAGLVPGEEKQAHSRYLTEGEEVRFLFECPDWLGLMCRLILHTGIRRGEILALRWPNVNLERATLTVVDAKNGETRTIPLDAEALAILTKQSKGDRCLSGHVFYNANKTAHTLRRVSRCVTDAVKRAGLDGIGEASSDEGMGLHTLRHTFASRWAINGGGMYELQIILGHKDPKMTQRYAHLSTASLHKEMNRVVQNAAQSETANQSVTANA